MSPELPRRVLSSTSFCLPLFLPSTRSSLSFRRPLHHSPYEWFSAFCINYPSKEPLECRRWKRNTHAVTIRGILTDKRNLVVPFSVIYASRDPGISPLAGREDFCGKSERFRFSGNRRDDRWVFADYHRSRRISVIQGIFMCCNLV